MHHPLRSLWSSLLHIMFSSDTRRLWGWFTGSLLRTMTTCPKVLFPSSYSSLQAVSHCFICKPKLDPFNPSEPNPNLTGALDSSLWEVYSHKRHYHAGVSTLVKVFGEAFTKMPYGMEDFLDHGYGTVSRFVFKFIFSFLPYRIICASSCP
jgi:hypothetical protein